MHATRELLFQTAGQVSGMRPALTKQQATESSREALGGQQDPTSPHLHALRSARALARWRRRRAALAATHAGAAIKVPPVAPPVKPCARPALAALVSPPPEAAVALGAGVRGVAALPALHAAEVWAHVGHGDGGRLAMRHLHGATQGAGRALLEPPAGAGRWHAVPAVRACR